MSAGRGVEQRLEPHPDTLNDSSALWGNYVVSERINFNHNRRRHVNAHFWRTFDGVELGYVLRARQSKQELTFVPYFAWAHRGVGEMAVWLKRGM
jgi:hypothetical protein